MKAPIRARTITLNIIVETYLAPVACLTRDPCYLVLEYQNVSRNAAVIIMAVAEPVAGFAEGLILPIFDMARDLAVWFTAVASPWDSVNDHVCAPS